MYLSQIGYKKVDNFIDQTQIDHMLTLFQSDRKVIELDRKSAEARIGATYKMVEELVARQPDYSVTFSKLWLVHSQYRNVDNTKLPYLPHFDRLRFLKVMIYLTDTDSNNGAFFACSANVHETESRRRLLPKNHKEAFMNDASSLGAFEPVVGKAGDAIIFDTNCPHYAGSVKDGTERKVARFDFTNVQWNSYWDNSVIDRLKRGLTAFSH